MKSSEAFWIAVAVLVMLLVTALGCDRRTRYRYFPTAPDTVFVHDTVTVDPPCDPPGKCDDDD